MFMGGQSKVGGKLTKNLNFNNCDVEFVCDTGANISILTEATIDMPSLELRKPDCQLTSANCLDLHVAEACNVCINKHSHAINSKVCLRSQRFKNKSFSHLRVQTICYEYARRWLVILL